ncbi:hypothetical protein Vi05172_g9346 [Venturia inaequalis]|nr:hypothetical protein Vi05172_g9346 [Venturia inaequalis]
MDEDDYSSASDNEGYDMDEDDCSNASKNNQEVLQGRFKYAQFEED